MIEIQVWVNGAQISLKFHDGLTYESFCADVASGRPGWRELETITGFKIKLRPINVDVISEDLS